MLLVALLLFSIVLVAMPMRTRTKAGAATTRTNQRAGNIARRVSEASLQSVRGVASDGGCRTTNFEGTATANMRVRALKARCPTTNRAE